MKNSIYIFTLFLGLLLFAQDIKISYSIIDELYPNENFNMIVKVSDGKIAIKEIYLITVTMQGSEEKRIKMDYSDKTASISLPFPMVSKTDFYYYFEIIKKDNEILYFPLLPSERIKNKVTHKKEQMYVPTKPVLLSPLTGSNLTPENFLFVVYVDGKSGELNLIVDGEDVTEKCIVGDKILTYNPGRIFQLRKYRFDIIQNGVLLQTYYFNFASEGFVRSLLNGTIFTDISYHKTDSNLYMGNIGLNLFGGLSLFYYKLRITLGNSMINSKNYVEKYNITLALERQKIDLGVISLSEENPFVSKNSIIGGALSSNIGYFGMKLLYGNLNDNLINGDRFHNKEAGGVLFNFKNKYFLSEVGVYRFCDIGDSVLDAYKSDDIILYHRELVKVFNERLVLDYIGGVVSSKQALYNKSFNMFEDIDSTFLQDIFSSYSQNVKASILSKRLNMIFEFEEISNSFGGFYLALNKAGKENLSLMLETPFYSESFVLGSKALFSFLRSDSNKIFDDLNERDLDFFISFKESGFPSIYLNYLDRVWNNSVYDTADYFQRLFGFQSNISAVFYLWNIQTKALLFLEQLNYKVTYNDSENYSIGGGFIEVSANVINNLNLTLGLNNHLTKKIETSVRNDIYKIGIDCENLFSFITPDISSAFHIESDSSSSNLKRIGISSGIKMMIKDFVFATSLEWNIIHNENPVNYISVHSNMRYDF